MRLGHVALRVSDITQARTFYQKVFSMQTVWEPDPHNVYLSCGNDNLALHQIPDGESLSQASSLDHIGFIVDTPEEVDKIAAQVKAWDIPLVHPVRLHRDGSYSFYINDPDKNLIQVLYIPHTSKAPVGV